MDTGTRSYARRDLRVSDAERDRAIDELSEHFQAGRLTQEEFEDRSGRALRARTWSDLHALFTDLPRSAVPAPNAAEPGVGPALGRDGLARAGRAPVASVVILCVLAVSVIGAALGSAGPGRGHGGFGWVLPVLILGFIFIRRAARRC